MCNVLSQFHFNWHALVQLHVCSPDISFFTAQLPVETAGGRAFKCERWFALQSVEVKSLLLLFILSIPCFWCLTLLRVFCFFFDFPSQQMGRGAAHPPYRREEALDLHDALACFNACILPFTKTIVPNERARNNAGAFQRRWVRFSGQRSYRWCIFLPRYGSVCSCECARKVLIQRVEERARESVDDDDALSCIFMISCAVYFLKLVFTFQCSFFLSL